MTIKVNCPTCKTQVLWNSEAEFRPFCSKRCQLIDLGEWANEEKKISQPVTNEQLLSEEMLDQLEQEFVEHNTFFVEPE
ncbi:DNA gyrase inhibitor YacG [Thalassotalea aquiviva]|uniref:DNA gyrase inhibitor YacG n=1 Tax=Thalassotalea aquiviva TaxID=3242415 RepID=UPI00352B1264